MPKYIVESEVDYLRKLGVKIELNSVIGKIETVDELLNNGFDAVFLGTEPACQCLCRYLERISTAYIQPMNT